MPAGVFWFAVFWLFAFGAAVGSFLNVVVYRLPNGLSLVYPPSHCPKCATPIRWYDNVPIFGWIKLRGRCRQCRSPISARYPAVEAFTAVLFVLVGVADLADGIAYFPSHIVLLCTLLCAVLIEFDGNRPPLGLFVPALIVGVGMQYFLPELRPATSNWWGLRPSLIGLVDGLAVLALGGVFAWTVFRQKALGFAFSLVCVLVFLGWQAGCVLAAATAAILLLAWALRWGWPTLRIPPTLPLGILAFAWILAEASLVSR